MRAIRIPGGLRHVCRRAPVFKSWRPGVTGRQVAILAAAATLLIGLSGCHYAHSGSYHGGGYGYGKGSYRAYDGYGYRGHRGHGYRGHGYRHGRGHKYRHH